MKLTSCRVQNFRSILDSGWVEVDDIAVIVGKNESGKTSFLKALWKFNPFQEVAYNIDREWPSGRRREKSREKIVASTKFAFTAEEIGELEKIHESARGFTGVEISRNYAGHYAYQFIPQNPNVEPPVAWIFDLIQNRLGTLPENLSDHFATHYHARLGALAKKIRDGGGSAQALAALPEFKNEWTTFLHPQNPAQKEDGAAMSELNKRVDDLIQEIASTPLLRVIDFVHARLPTFIYMDDHRTFIGSAQLDEILKHKKEKRLSSEEETIIVILTMSGLKLEDEVAKGHAEDRQQRNLDMDDASNTITALIADNWRQRKYQVEFRADGQHFNTYVKDQTDLALVPLEDRSKGFQWFFSFDMRFMYETKGQFRNAIILLDEPGLHLHAAAQHDLLARMKEYAKDNQLIYTTHLPFMIDFNRLDNIFVSEETSSSGSKVHKNWAAAGPDARFTLQAALGIAWSQSLFAGQYNLVVKGVDDFWFLTTFSTLFEEAGQKGLPAELEIIPAGGASKVAYIGTILHGQKRPVSVLLDSDPAGELACEQLVGEWMVKDKLVLMIGEAVGAQPCALEDFFGENYYLTKVKESFVRELMGKTLLLDPKTAGKKTIVARINDSFVSLGLGEFNKGRVSKRIIMELSKRSLGSVDAETISKFRKLIDAINSTVASWKKP